MLIFEAWGLQIPTSESVFFSPLSGELEGASSSGELEGASLTPR